MSTWSVYVEGSGTSWDWDYELQRPNENLETQVVSNSTKTRLANGSPAFMNLETKWYTEQITFTFLMLDISVVNKIDAYIKADTIVKIVTHTGEEFEGRFMSRNRVWLTGVSPDSYDMQVTFQPLV